jgi:cyclopropane fatty-acyl-phospholipid synthase-like methyltransferase
MHGQRNIKFHTDVSEKSLEPFFDGQLSWDCFALEDGTDTLSRNVCTELLFYAA